MLSNAKRHNQQSAQTTSTLMVFRSVDERNKAAGMALEVDGFASRPVINGPPGKYLQAHDHLVQLIQDAYDKDEPGWFGQTATGYKFADKDLDKAMQLFTEFVRRQAEKDVGEVLAQLAPRQYLKDGEDVIAAGLVQRLTNDVMMGLVETWKTQRTEQMFARRQVEYMARLADLGAMARGLYDTAPGLPGYA